MQDNANIIKVSYPADFITVKEDKRDGGWSEISVYVDAAVPFGAKICAAIITHPCVGAKWFVHDRDTGCRGIPFKTKKAAVAAAVEAAKGIKTSAK